MSANVSAVDDRATHAETVKLILGAFLGKQSAQSVLYHTGEPDPSSFEGKLAEVFGGGAEVIVQEIHRKTTRTT